MEKISYYLFPLAALLLNFQMPFPATSLTTQATDQSALLALKAHIILDPYQILTHNWTNSSFVCSWIGVTCNSRHHRVAALNISDMGLVGTIPPQLGNLSFLVSLDLRYNFFSGSLPEELSLLHRLKFIVLGFNNFNGEVPMWFGFLSKLEVLSLRNNSFTGFIPYSISNLSNLKELDFTFNSLQGNIPEELGKLKSLEVLKMASNHLSGSISSAIFNMSSLKSLGLGSNTLSGILPSNMCRNLPYLEMIALSWNQFSGQIPSNLSECSQLQLLSLSYNSFSGQIPGEIGKLTSLQILHLGGNNLNGVIPQQIGDLQNLVEFTIEENKITGSVPLFIFNISSLQILDLHSNKLTGSLPREIGNLTSLTYLSLSNNNLTDRAELYGTKTRRERYAISKQLFGARMNEGTSVSEHVLKMIQLIHKMNDLDVLLDGDLCVDLVLQSLPKSYDPFVINFNMNNLNASLNELLNMLITAESTIKKDKPVLLMNSSSKAKKGNKKKNKTKKLKGLLRQEIGKLYQLEVLSLQYNSFTGSIPSELFNISTLRFLQLAANGLSASLPTNLGYMLPFLERLLLDGNYLSGSIPESISNCSNLKLLSLNSNNFTGFVPHFFGDLRLLKILYLGDNHLRTESSSSSSELNFITSLTNCRVLNKLAVDHNPLDGIIPASIGNLSTSLQYFYASNCKIKGDIPEEIGNLSNLMVINLEDNEFTGKIPFTVKHLQKLQGLALANIKMEGSIPDALCDLHSLDALILSQNRFSGSIPECLGNMASLRSLVLNSNMLSSSIPLSLWRNKDLLELDLSSNSLSGFLPPEIGNLVSAIRIDLSMNNLSKDIPSTIGNLQVLADLSLAHNSLDGSIPASVGSMINLKTLDLSYNNLSGSIPKSLEKLQHLDYFNVSFNVLRGEIPSGGSFRNFTMESFMGNEALCGIPRFHVSLCNTFFKHKSKKKRLSRALLVLSAVVSLIVVIISLAFILTRNRRRNKLVGENGVPKPKVPERFSYYELLRATEQFSESNLLGVGGFGSVYKGVMREGEVLAVKVFNLQFQGVFRSFDVECEVLRNLRHRNLTKVIGSCSNEDFKALILEYMPKGNLEKWLYSHNYCLDLMQRLNIMIDVASALEYLHHGYSSQIVHCDLKPSNVLLDEEMIAHVSDFGIAKLLGEGESISHTETLSTFGYMAPEYGLEGLISTRCDVYSYGIMLIETFTRKRPNDDMFGQDFSLRIWVERSLPNQVIDANLMHPVEEHFDKSMQCVTSIMELALKCSAECPRDRINMKEALADLQKIKRQFLM